MLIVLTVVAMLGLLAQPLLSTGFRQLRVLSDDKTHVASGVAEALQWLENDILQWHGFSPWTWQGTAERGGCLVTWEFVTGNTPVTEGTKIARETVRYRMEGETLWRDVMRNERVIFSRELLRGVRCLNPRFWQSQQWFDVPQPDQIIQGIKLSLTWQGPSVERIWPVTVPYNAQ
jgi:hypothetical protein